MAGLQALLIVKDEAPLLPGLLGALSGAVDRVWVGDTGSTDGSQAIAQAAGAQVVAIPWREHYAQARNALQQHVPTKGWALWVDADHLPSLAGEALGRWLRACLATTQRPTAGPWGWQVPLAQWESGQVVAVERWGLLSPLGVGLRWEGRLHERLVDAAGQPLPWFDGPKGLFLRHTGHEADRLRAKAKPARYAALLAQAQAEEPQKARWPAFAARDALQAGQDQEALDLTRRALALGAETPGEEAWFLALQLEALLRLGHHAEAGALGLTHWPRLRPTQAEPWAMSGLALVGAGQWAEAVAHLSLALRMAGEQGAAPEAQELGGWLGAGALALALEAQAQGPQADVALGHALLAAPSPEELWARLALLGGPGSPQAAALARLRGRGEALGAAGLLGLRPGT